MGSPTPVSQALTDLGIPHREFRHPGPIHSLEQAARERSQQPQQVVRSILFRLEKDSYVMVLVAGPEQISWRSLRRHLGQSRLTMASPDEVQRVTGYAIGAVSPFGIPSLIPVLVDSSVLDQDEISLGSGVRGTAVIMKSADLMKAMGDADVGDFHSAADDT